MWEYLRRHEAWVGQALAGESGQETLAEVARFHAVQLERMQHERLVHLLVTLAVALFSLMTLGFVYERASWPGLALATLLLVLLCAYLVHYFRLENGVQRWYRLANALDVALGKARPATLLPPNAKGP